MRKRSSQTHGPGGWPARVSVAAQYGGAHRDGGRSLNGPNTSLTGTSGFDPTVCQIKSEISPKAPTISQQMNTENLKMSSKCERNI